MAKQKGHGEKAGVSTENPDIGHPTAEEAPIINAELSPANPKGILEIPSPGVAAPNN